MLCGVRVTDQVWTDTPWHMDCQYYEDAAASPAHVLSIWIPIQAVDSKNSCLECAPAVSTLIPGWDDPLSGFRGLSPQDQAALGLEQTGVVCPLEVGDVVCLHQRVPHRALPNLGENVRWSIDVRFESCPGGDWQRIATPSEQTPFDGTCLPTLASLAPFTLCATHLKIVVVARRAGYGFPAARGG